MDVRLLPLNDETLHTAAEALKAGLLVAFPTETVYGLGGDGFNRRTLARIFQAKARPRFDPLILHIADRPSLDRVADLSALTPRARRNLDTLISRLWPGPLTLILPKQPDVPDLATSGLPTAAVRFPDHPGAQRLIALSTGVLAAPSANPFGRLSPTRAEHVRDGLGDQVDLILDGGPTRVGLESTVLDLCAGDLPRILRPGGIPREQIEALIGPIMAPGTAEVPGTNPEAPGTDPAAAPAAPRSPGQLPGHYAPRTPLRLHSPAEMAALPNDPAAGYLFFAAPSRDAWTRTRRLPPDPRFRALSETGDPAEAAANLFDLLHILDTLGLARILAEAAPTAGLGAAINDRLTRAALAPGTHFPPR
jgi:L-threonylcarbamoyladenylate synthase